MRTAILVIWALGLAGALVPTVVILKQASLVVWALIDIAKLAVLTRDAANGIAGNVAVIPTFPDLAVPGGDLTEATEQSAATIVRLGRMLIDVRGS